MARPEAPTQPTQQSNSNGAEADDARLVASAHGLDLGYGARTVLSDVRLDIHAATVTALIGPNGAGKSTLLHALAGLLRPRGGELEVAARRDRAGVALVLQATESNARLPLTVREVVAMGRYPYVRMFGRATAADRAAVDAALDLLELRDIAGEQIRELSGGQQQRAFVAQGFAQQSQLLVLDEPFTGLDLVSHSTILDAVRHARDERRTVVLSTHDLADLSVADQVVLIAGRVIAAGSRDEVLTDEHLASAYGSRLVQIGGRVAVLDDPHDHPHSEQNADGHDH